MNRKLWMIVGGALTALAVIGGVGAVAVQAQSPTPPAAPDGAGLPNGLRGGPHVLDQAELDAAAKALGMTADDLSAQLKSGKTLEEIATAKGVEPKTVMEALRAVRPLMLGTAELDAAAKALGMTSADLSAAMKSGKTLSDLATQKGVALKTVQDAIQAARDAEFTGQVKQAVTDGKITQDKANWLLEGLSKGYLNGPDGFGFGLGFGRGGGHGPGGPQPQVSPTATP